MFNLNDRVGVFIDGPNHYQALLASHIKMDYKILVELFRENSRLPRFRFYTGLADESELSEEILTAAAKKFKTVRALADWMAYNGFVVVSKPLRENHGIITGNLDVEIAVDMVMMAPSLDHIILFSGDGDFVYPIKQAQILGAKVTVVSATGLISNELKKQADEFIDIIDFVDENAISA